MPFPLAYRSDQSELMDDHSISFEEFQQTLSEIEKINCLTGAYRPTLKALEAFVKSPHHAKTAPVRILDVGFGNGDFLRRIYKWAEKKGIVVELTGIDLNPYAERAARTATPPSMNITYLTNNVFNYTPANPYHIIINSLFTHHLKNDEVIQVMQWMTSQAMYGWVINDLHRTLIPYLFIRYFVRIFGFNRLVRNDAPLSVARSFTRDDWQQLIDKTGIKKDKTFISWYWPFRYGVRYVK